MSASPGGQRLYDALVKRAALKRQKAKAITEAEYLRLIYSRAERFRRKPKKWAYALDGSGGQNLYDQNTYRRAVTALHTNGVQANDVLMAPTRR